MTRSHSFTPMIRNRLILLVGAVMGMSGCATSKQPNASLQADLENIQRTLSQMSAAINDLQGKVSAPRAQERACYLNDRAYSPGAIVDNRICDELRKGLSVDEPPTWGWRATVAGDLKRFR